MLFGLTRLSQLPWPAAGGAIASIRHAKETNAAPNAGLSKALKYLEPVKLACPDVSWADLIQMGSATAIEMAGGPKIDMRYGRLDANESPAQSVAPFGLPSANPEDDPASHLRWVRRLHTCRQRCRHGKASRTQSPRQCSVHSGCVFDLSLIFTLDCAVRQVFGKYDGMGDQEIVALSGAHTLGRAFKVNSRFARLRLRVLAFAVDNIYLSVDHPTL